MHLQDIDSSLQIRAVDNDSPVKTAGPQQRRIQYLRPVGRRQDQKTFGGIESVHLRQKLIQRLLPLIVSAAVPAVTALSDGIDLIDENNAGRILLCFLEKVSHTGSAHTYKHFHKIRTGKGKEGHMGLPGHRLGQKCLSGTGRSHQQGAFWQLRTDLRIFGRVMKEIHHFLQGLLGFILSGHILEGHSGFFLHIGLGLALSDSHHSAAFVHMPHQKRQTDEHQHDGEHQANDRRENRRRHVGLPFLKGDTLVFQPLRQRSAILHGDGGILEFHSLYFLFFGDDGQFSGLHDDLIHFILIHHLYEFVITNLPARRTAQIYAEDIPKQQRDEGADQ